MDLVIALMAGILMMLALEAPLYGFLLLYESSQKIFKPIAEGEFAHITYRPQRTYRHIRMSQLAKRSGFTLSLADIHFKDGKTCLVGNFQDVPPRGTYIKISKNGFAQFKMETVSKTA